MTILHLFLVLSLMIVPMCLYRCSKSYMLMFYIRMTRSCYFRKLYALILLLVILMFHFTYFAINNLEYGMMLSTVVLIYLFSPKRTEGLLSGIRGNKSITALLFTMALASCFIPHLYTLGGTLAYILLASLFYPSVKMAEYKTTSLPSLYDETDIKMLVKDYYI